MTIISTYSATLLQAQWCSGCCASSLRFGVRDVKIVCAHCRKKSEKRAGDANRARVAGLNIYCNRRCAGLARRKGKTKAQKVAEKKAYDAEYRKKNLTALKAKKHEYFQRTYDPVKAAEVRKGRMPYHVEYCRKPAYKAKKREYDRKHRAAEFGEFAEAYMLTIDLNREIKGRTTNAEIKWENRTANKTQFRKREVAGGQERSRPRHRERRDRDQAAHG
jgi:hypothetical protein